MMRCAISRPIPQPNPWITDFSKCGPSPATQAMITIATTAPIKAYFTFAPCHSNRFRLKHNELNALSTPGTLLYQESQRATLGSFLEFPFIQWVAEIREWHQRSSFMTVGITPKEIPTAPAGSRPRLQDEAHGRRLAA